MEKKYILLLMLEFTKATMFHSKLHKSINDSSNINKDNINFETKNSENNQTNLDINLGEIIDDVLNLRK